MCHCVVNLPGNLHIFQLLKDCGNAELTLHSVIFEGIEDHTLCSASRIGSDSVRSALARNRREPTVRDSEVGGHEVVVIQEVLIVVTHSALPGKVREFTGTLAASGV